MSSSVDTSHNSPLAFTLSRLVQLDPLLHRHGRSSRAFNNSTFWLSVNLFPATLDFSPGFFGRALTLILTFLIGSLAHLRHSCDTTLKSRLQWTCYTLQLASQFFIALQVAETGCYTRNFFCNLPRNDVALQVADKIASCNRALTGQVHFFYGRFNRWSWSHFLTLKTGTRVWQPDEGVAGIGENWWHSS